MSPCKMKRYWEVFASKVNQENKGHQITLKKINTVIFEHQGNIGNENILNCKSKN